MQLTRFCRRGFGLALAVLAIFLVTPQARAQDRLKIEIVPNISHSRIRSLAFSPDGKRALSAGSRGRLKLWDAKRGLLIRNFVGHTSDILAVAFSPNGRFVLSGSGDNFNSNDNSVRLWDAASGELIRTFEGRFGPVTAVAFSPDGRRIFSKTGAVRMWDAASGQLMRTFENPPAGTASMALSPDGSRLLTGGFNGALTLQDTTTGRLIRDVEGHSGAVISVAFSPDGRFLLSGGGGFGSSDDSVKLWSASSGKLIRTLEGHSGEVHAVAFSPDGKRVVSGADTLRVWDAAEGNLIRSIEDAEANTVAFRNGPRMQLGGRVNAVAFSPDGRRLLSGYSDTFRMWDPASGQLLRTFEGFSAPVVSATFSPDGTRLLAGSGASQFNDTRKETGLWLWDVASGQLIRKFDGHTSGVSSVAFSPDGTRLLSAEDTLRLWDAATGRHIRAFARQRMGAASVVFSPDGTRLLSGSVDRTLKLWDAVSGQLMRTFEGHSKEVNSVAFSPDGTHVLSGSGGFSSKGEGKDNTLKLWDAASGQLIRTFDGHSDRVLSVAFSPDGRFLLSGSADSTLRLWDAASGHLLRTFEGHTSAVLSVAFSPDGTRLASGGGAGDGTLRLWQAASAKLIRTIEVTPSVVNSVGFSPEGTRLLSASSDGVVRLWNPETGELLASLFGARDGHWVAMTPPGFFASSGGTNELLAIVRGFDVTTIDQVHQSLFNPDLVREALADDPSGEVREAAKVISLDKVIDSGPAPTVAITSHPERGQSASDLVTVRARIEDQGKGIGRIEWRVNGITAAVSSKPPRGSPGYMVTQQLALDPGENVVEVVAFNASNLLASLPARTSIKFTGAADLTKPKLHILAIGINSYVDRGWTAPGAAALQFGPLGLAVKDAEAFGATMKTAAAGLYDEVRVTLALDHEATRDNLERIVGKVAREIDRRDSFILFAAGHGTSENGQFYFIPQDYQSGPDHLARRAIGQDRLQEWLANRIKAKRAIILLDTCESGALVAGHARSRADVPASEAAVGRLHEATGRPVLTAAAVGQFAHEGLIGITGERHGVFTWAVLDALRKGDTNGNGTIELSELVRHVQSVVPKVAAGIVRAATSEPVLGKQAARFGSRGEDFAVARRLQ